MRTNHKLYFLLSAMFLAALLYLFPQRACAASPRLMLWAWERKEDLRFIDTRQTGVAFLAKTLFLDKGRVYEKPRFQPLYVSTATYLMAVVRIETTRPGAAGLSSAQAQAASAKIIAAARLHGVKAVQIDFDAVLSQRKFYKELIRNVRKGLPASQKFSITALTSWCAGDRWLSGLPVDEAVPMLFRMGRDTAMIRHDLSGGVRLPERLCGTSAGFSVDEPFFPVAPERLIYVFNPKPWTQANFDAMKERLKI